MLVYKSYKTELSPSNEQKTLLKQYTGCARFVWNWALAKEQEFYEKDIGFHSAIDLQGIWTCAKYAEEQLRWVQNISSSVPEYVFRDLERAFKDFFKENKGYPKFKKRKDGIGSFRIRRDSIIKSNEIYIPKLGWIKLKEKGYIPEKKCCYITVSERMGRWFVSATFEEEITPTPVQGPVIGVDLGINPLAKTSEDITYENPKSLSKSLKKLKRLQREVSRKKKGSNNRKKVVQKLNKLHEQITNIRKDSIHKVTTILTKTKSVIGIETLNIKGMLRNKNLSRAISDSSMGEFGRQIKYKSVWYGSKVVTAPKFYPSSKMCCKCGNIKKSLELSDRTYYCPKCYLVIDRDLNAAINLSKLASSSEESVNAYKKWEVTGTPNIKIIPVPINEVGIEPEVSKETSISFKERSFSDMCGGE